MARPKEPLDAYATAYEALAGTAAEHDPEFRTTVARQVVDTLMRARAERGLNYLRGMCSTARYNEMAQSNERDPALLVGRAAMHRAYELTAEVFVAAFARPSNHDERG